MSPCLLVTLLLTIVVAGCPGQRPTEETPDGALTLFLDAMKQGDRDAAYELLAPETQRELQGRARIASKQAQRDLEPSEMIAIERFVTRWEVSRMTAEVQGDTALVTATGSEEGRRAEVTMRKNRGRWRVVLPLSDDSPR